MIARFEMVYHQGGDRFWSHLCSIDRHSEWAKPGRYLVIALTEMSKATRFFTGRIPFSVSAVVDDFGNLVRVD